MHSIINHVGERVRGGAKFEDGIEDGDTLTDYKCVFREVHKFWYPWVLGQARWFYRGDDFPALQLIWPDKQHHYPWDSQYRDDWYSLQPLLFESDPECSRGAALLKSMSQNE